MTANQDLKMCPGNAEGCAAWLNVAGFEDKVHLHMCTEGFYLKNIPFETKEHSSLFLVEFSTHKPRWVTAITRKVFEVVPSSGQEKSPAT